MYSRPQFKMPSEKCLDLIQNKPFGLLSTCLEGRVTQAFLPFLLDRQANCLYGHLAIQNEQINALASCQDLRVTFQGEQAYISPSWYESSEQVPTWNYQVVSVTGKADLLNDQETLEIITKLSNYHEAQFDQPWTINKLPQRKIEAMLNAIVGIRIDILEIVGINKMSQNKMESDQRGVVVGLKNQSDHSSIKIAKIIANKGD